jgi:hypothetical protein
MSAILSLYDFKTLKDIITTFINKIKEITMDVPLWHFKLSSKWLICSIAVSWIMSTVIAGLPLAGWNIVNSTNLKCTENARAERQLQHNAPMTRGVN